MSNAADQALNGSDEIYRLSAGPYRDGQLVVCSFRGREALSKLYQFDIVVTSAMLDDTLERTVLGRRAMLTLQLGDVHRDFHGIVSGIEAQGLRGSEGNRLAQHRIRLVPRAWLLRKRKGSRIFQDMRVDQVIASVLRDAGVPSRFRLQHPHPVRKYCTQYAETDFDFIARLAAEHGMFFYFEQPRDYVDGPGEDLLGAAAGLAGGLANEAGRAAGSALGGAIGGSLGGLGDAIGGAVGSALGGGLGGAMGALLHGEVLVFCDNARSYPPLDDDAVADVAGRIGGAAADEMLGMARNLAGGVMGELAGAMTSAAGEAGGIALQAASALGLPGDVPGEILGALGSRAPAPSLHYRESDALRGPSHDSIAAFASRQALRATASAYREYDPDRPYTVFSATGQARGLGVDVVSSLAGAAVSALGGAISGALPGAVSGAISGALPGAVSGAAGALGSALGLGPSAPGASPGMEVYEHHGRDLFPDWPYAHDEPRRILHQSRRRGHVAQGKSFCARLHSGRRFVLEDHLQEHMNREHIVTAVEHHGVARPSPDEVPRPAVYRNTFRSVPAEVPFVPPRPEQRVVQTCLTATVVGPPGQDIHVNAKGEIKVRFHWDRAGRGEDSSCWIRTMHAWGGAGWGTQFIPRVGMEVVVAFDEGDPDRPLVLGAVYNATHPTTFPLPAQKTRSGIRTQSSPGGNGYNELSFEDAASGEQIFLHAQRDFDSVVERDRTARIQRDDRTEVIRDRAAKVHGTQTTRVTGDRTTELASADHLRVEGSRDVTVRGDLNERVGGQRTLRVEGREHTEIAGERRSLIGGEVVHEVRGAATMLVGKHDAKRSCTLIVEGVTQLTGSEIVDLASDTELVLRCGESSIRLSPKEIEIASPKVTVRGKDARLLLQNGKAKLKAKALFQVVSDDKVVLKSSGASLGLGSQAKLDGAKVLLNSPEAATDAIQVDEPEPTKIELVDQDGHPIPYQRFRIVQDDGSHYAGFLDENGKAEVDIEEPGEILFPELSNVENA